MRRKLGILAVVFLTTIPVWSLALLSGSPKPLFILQAEHKFSDGSVAFSRSGQYLAFCTGAGVTLCQITEDRQTRITAELPVAATSVAFTHDSKSLLAPSGPEGLLVL